MEQRRHADIHGIAAAVAALQDGKLVAFPTETVYGLGADATNDRAVARIFKAKGRPRFNPLIVHAPDARAHTAWARFDERAEQLIKTFWPGELTLVLPRHEDAAVSRLTSAGLDTIAVRSPDHPVAQRLLREVRCPVAAPSANRSGLLSPTTADHVVAALGNSVELVLDGGACSGGLESTVVSLTGETPTLLRPGLVTRREIEAVIGNIAVASDETAVEAPGMLPSHYAPHARVRLNAGDSEQDGEVLLAFGAAIGCGYSTVLNLSEAGDLVEAAANLFRMLHDLDGLNPVVIAVAPVPAEGLGVAINDRLRRAAA